MSKHEINWTEECYGNSVLFHLLITAINQVYGDDTSKFINEAFPINPIGDTYGDVSLLINGEKFDIKSVMNEWEKQLDDMIETKAGKMIRNQLVELSILHTKAEYWLRELQQEYARFMEEKGFHVKEGRYDAF